MKKVADITRSRAYLERLIAEVARIEFCYPAANLGLCEVCRETLARLEEAESWLPALYGEIVGNPPGEEKLKSAMSVDREYNTGRGEKPNIEWGMLPPRVIETAESYGYSAV